MPDEHTLTLHQADQARTDFALIESNLEFIASQLGRLPTRADLAKTAHGIIISTAALGLWLPDPQPFIVDHETFLLDSIRTGTYSIKMG